ncbi:phosphoribosylformylglycinamidine cyclo-ligase [Streptococcaceae bacterium ESL0687]|nr:phosphoribosylformylglycinamidine cyclo-ligase [Streptococcaceae bacterium ESL0687]
MANEYAKAGVDVEAGYEVVERIKKHAKRTERKGVMGALGGFGGCFDLSQYDLKEPVLVSGTDGVGTKLMLAIKEDRHDTIGIDCVAMCVNDIVAQGAEPLYFLDYIATGKNVPERLEQVVAGVSQGCLQAGAALIGGETAEMPGMYDADDYDLAGFAVGIAEKSQLVTGEKIKEGHVLLGLPSSGIHSNGYSLVRKVFFQSNDFSGDSLLPELDGQKLADALLEPTKIYVEELLPLVKNNLVDGISHITGGGFVENIPRMLPDNLAAQIELGSWPVLNIFKALEKYGQIPSMEMYEIFNMGLGMVLAVDPSKLEAVKEQLTMINAPFYQIGSVTEKVDQAVVFLGEQA